MALSLPPNLSDQLSAVNVLLGSIGESPISSLSGGQAADATTALETLNEILLAVQSEGWPWNKDYALSLTPAEDGRIALPGTALRITKAYPGNHSGSLVERGRYLYDNVAHSYGFTEAVSVDLVSLLAFEDIPQAARRYITTRAARLFQARQQTSAGVDAVTQDEEAQARKVLEDERDEAEPQNGIAGNTQVRARLYGKGMRRRGTGV